MKNNILLSAYYSLHTIKGFFGLKPFSFIKSMSWYILDYLKFNKLNKSNKAFNTTILYPLIQDKTSNTPLDPVYFYQDSWAAKIIFKIKPEHHYDVGSSAKTIGIISQFVPTTMVDIRPVELKLDNLFFKEGSILNLPFKDNSISSLSSLCVVEHIGLGRYGDPLDAFGSEKAVAELKRVVKVGGSLLFSVPIDSKNKVFFNAHRAFTREYIINLFNGFSLMEEKYIYKYLMYDNYMPESGFGIGLYYFKKN